MMNLQTNTTDDIISNAKPSEYLALPPYVAELLYEGSGWAGVMNKNGVNCLTFTNKPGAVVTDFETAKLIADKWNRRT